MGGGPEVKHDRMLCILPMKEPKEILDRIKERFPNTEITYFHLEFHADSAWKTYKEVPTGRRSSHRIYKAAI